jgi:hypothetical protein
LKPYHHQIGNGDELVIDFTSTGYYDPGVRSGPVESCYPPEGDDERKVEAVYIQKANGERIPLDNVVEEIESLFQDDIQDAEIDTSPEEPNHD